MTNTQYMIGSRLTYSQMDKVIPRVRHMNQGMAKTLRKAAMDNGIKQTEQGCRLEFYTVSGEELDTLKHPTNDAFLALTKDITVRPLVQFDKDKFSIKLDEINSKPEYQGGMAYEVHRKYEKELRKAMAELCEVIGTDTNKRNKADTFTGDNPYKVGDYIIEYGRSGNEFSKVVKVTPKGIVTGFLLPKAGVVSNKNYALFHFNNVVNKQPDRPDHGGFFIPLKGNEDKFQVSEHLRTTRFGGYNDGWHKDPRFSWKNMPTLAKPEDVGYDQKDYWEYCN